DHSFVEHERLWLKNDPELTEKWVQKLIAEDPAILGLGDLVLRDQERIQPRAGRLDLLLQEPDTKHRYEVELQLGATDGSHGTRLRPRHRQHHRITARAAPRVDQT